MVTGFLLLTALEVGMGGEGIPVRSELNPSIRQRMILSSRQAWLRMKSLYHCTLDVLALERYKLDG